MIGRDGPDGKVRREQNREGHRRHLHKLIDDGSIVFAGPIRDDYDDHSTGAVIVLRADNLTRAREIVQSDPYVVGGVFESLEVNAFRQAIPELP